MASGFAAEITGAGATFPEPIYARWAKAYHEATGNRLDYHPMGSIVGIRLIKSKRVDFGATDVPLGVDELEKGDLIQFPTVFGAVVPVVNVAGVKPGEMRLTGPVLGDIYLGRITKWNDQAISRLNPALRLPDQSIRVVYRADASGTSAIFTRYLRRASAGWKRIGEGATVPWPVGSGGSGNQGVSAHVQRVSGSIGYVEFAYAKQKKLSHVQLRNQAGHYVQPDERAVQAAAAGWGEDGTYGHPVEHKGAISWPITGATYILVHRAAEKTEQALEVLKFFDWAYRNGSKMALELDYVPMPEEIVRQVRQSWAEIADDSGKSVWPAR